MWDCTSAVQLTYNLGGTAIAHEAMTPEQKPLAHTMWGTCDAGQLIPSERRDAARHGKVRAYTLSSPHSQRKACVCLGPVGTLSLSPWPRRGGATAIRGGGTHVDGGPYVACRGRRARRDGRGDLDMGRVRATVVHARSPTALLAS